MEVLALCRSKAHWRRLVRPSSVQLSLPSTLTGPRKRLIHPCASACAFPVIRLPQARSHSSPWSRWAIQRCPSLTAVLTNPYTKLSNWTTQVIRPFNTALWRIQLVHSNRTHLLAKLLESPSLWFALNSTQRRHDSTTLPLNSYSTTHQQTCNKSFCKDSATVLRWLSRMSRSSSHPVTLVSQQSRNSQ